MYNDSITLRTRRRFGVDKGVYAIYSQYIYSIVADHGEIYNPFGPVLTIDWDG